MKPEKPLLRFARQDDETLSLLASVQWDTGYVPTMEELGQLLQCPTTGAARRKLDELLVSGEGTRLTSKERQEMYEVAERLLDNESPDTQRRHPVNRQRRYSRTVQRSHIRWARPEDGEALDSAGFP